MNFCFIDDMHALHTDDYTAILTGSYPLCLLSTFLQQLLSSDQVHLGHYNTTPLEHDQIPLTAHHFYGTTATSDDDTI